MVLFLTKFHRSQKGLDPVMWVAYVCIETKWPNLADLGIKYGILLCHGLRFQDCSLVRYEGAYNL